MRVSAVALAASLAGCFATVTAPPAGSRPTEQAQEFVYRDQTWRMDSHADLFNGNDFRARRRAIFENYVANSAEGQRRAKEAGSTVAADVWHTLTPEEQTTFLAITSGLATIEHPANKNTLLDWIDLLEEIRGLRQEPDGSVQGSHVYRLYAKLTKAAATLIAGGRADFVNTVTKKRLDFGGLGSTHDDYCASGKFELQRPTQNHPHLQFNLTSTSCCADIDIDYIRPPLPAHFRPDNSNVLIAAHLNTFAKQYIRPGFGLKP